MDLILGFKMAKAVAIDLSLEKFHCEFGSQVARPRLNMPAGTRPLLMFVN